MKRFYFLLAFYCIVFQLTAQDRTADSLILVQVYNNLDGPNWNNAENWLSDLPIEEWKGIRTQNGRVITLDIISQNAKGPFPNEILGLDKLRTFEIRSGEISGEIPAELTQLTDLNRFILSSTGIGGEIPNIWDQFDNLQYLGLSQNNLTGPLPDIGDDLILLTFQGNQLTGEIPDSWAGNPLGNLNISFNLLSGSFDILATWPNLIKIDLDSNDWEPATLPTRIDDNINLDRFSCNDCNLYGDIPDELDFSQHDKYSGMFLNDNDLSGDITNLFSGENSSAQLYLNVSFNNFSGELPAHAIKNFSRLVVRNNNFNSTTELRSDIELDVFDIAGNQFTYESLEPFKPYLFDDSNVPVGYSNQQLTLSADTLNIANPEVVTLFAGDAHPSTSYQWYHNNQVIEEGTNEELMIQVNDASDGGIYYCRMTNDEFPELDLSRNTIRIIANIIVSTDDLDNSRLSLFPNPTANVLKFESEKGIQQVAYKILAANGELVDKGYCMTRDSIDVTHLNSGIYLVQFDFGDKVVTERIVKL